MKATCERLRSRQRLWGELSDKFQEGLLSLDLETLRATYQQWMSWFLVGWLMLWSTRRKLQKVARRTLAKGIQVLEQLDQAIQIRTLDESLQKDEARLTALLGSLWQGVATDPERIWELARWVSQFRELLADLSEKHPGLHSTVSRLREWASDEERLRPSGQLRTWIESYQARHKAAQDWRHDWQSVLGLPAEVVADWSTVAEWIEIRRTHQAGLADWALFAETSHRAEQLGLSPLLSAVWKGEVAAEKLEQCVEQSYLRAWLSHYTENPPLNRFRGASHHEVLEEFRKLDHELITLNQRFVAAQLAEKVPAPSEGARGEMATLQREIKKQRAHKAPRQLFKEIPNLLPRLKPCLMMSPLSIAQFLDPANKLFDLVIFDEASQIAPWDALGALARGQQWIVVGDSRQLPPTSFFASAQEDDENDLELGGQLESILDECQAAGLPETSLTWHYRSSDERLIAFSNRYYYDNRLFTFPNAHLAHPRRGVHWVHVPDGVFGRGGTRQNRREAEVVVKALVERLLDPTVTQTFGVVTFNQAQQSLIENLLDEERAKHPEIERHFSNTLEPVFVKNLENVQGDERDVILFSIGYAADETGKFRLEFGPLGKRGGERRLNVAVSRARQQMWVFSSIQPEQIDLSRTNAQGTRDLRAFLDFSRRGVEALDLPGGPAHGEAAVGLEQSVKAALEERGWTVHARIGCSGYQIDLAVVDPREPGRYLAGVECDGEAYRSAATTRDRDRLRSAVLGQLGWRLLRVWSLDWWRNSERVVADLQAELERLQSEEPVEASVEVAVAAPEEPARIDLSQLEFEPEPQVELPVYKEVVLPERPLVPHEATARDIYTLLEPLLRGEGPVTVDYAFQRAVRAMGAQRVGARIRTHLEKQVAQLHAQNRVFLEGNVLWVDRTQKGNFSGFRTHAPGCARSLEDVPAVELDNALAFELERSMSIRERDLFQVVTRYFGKLKVGKDIAERLREGMLRLNAQGKCKLQGEMWVWVEV